MSPPFPGRFETGTAKWRLPRRDKNFAVERLSRDPPGDRVEYKSSTATAAPLSRFTDTLENRIVIMLHRNPLNWYRVSTKKIIVRVVVIVSDDGGFLIFHHH